MQEQNNIKYINARSDTKMDLMLKRLGGGELPAVRPRVEPDSRALLEVLRPEGCLLSSKEVFSSDILFEFLKSQPRSWQIDILPVIRL